MSAKTHYRKSDKDRPEQLQAPDPERLHDINHRMNNQTNEVQGEVSYDENEAAGSFVAPAANRVEAAKGSLLLHDKLIEFIQRNYESDAAGRWFFQNGPQRVYVELEATPFIWRVDATPGFPVTAHTGQPAGAQRCVLDEQGRLYLETNLGFGLVHTQDMAYAADAVEQGLWVPEEVNAADLPSRFGYVNSPQDAIKTIAA